MENENKHSTLTSLFTDVADAIRTAKGEAASVKYVADEFDLAVPEVWQDGNNKGKASGAAEAQAEYEPKSATLTNAGVLSVKNAAGTQKYTETFTNSYDKGVADTKVGTAVAAEVLSDKTFTNADGVGITGTMPNRGAVTNTISAQGGTYTIPAGYHNGSGVVTASITPSALDNDIISGEAIEEATGDYAWKSTVEVPAGYHNAQTLTKTFSEIFPAPSTPATAEEMLAGYQAYNKSGQLMTGTMPNNGETGTTISTQGGTYNIPAGYTSGGTVTANINNGVITSGAGSATISDPSYNSTSGKFDQSASGTVAAPTVGTAGYVSSGAGTKNPNTISGSKSLDKITGSTAITGTTKVTPAISRESFTITGVTDAASGAATTTAPTSGVYVKVKSAANTGTLTATPSVTNAGYGTSSQHGIAGTTATVGANGSADTYVPIQGGAINSPSGSATQSTPSFDLNQSTGVVTASVAQKTGTAYRNVTTAGWLGTSTTGGTFTMGGSSNTYTIPAANVVVTGSKTLDKPGMSFNATTGIVSASVGSTTISATPSVATNGYISGDYGNKTATSLTITGNSNSYNVGIASINAPSGSKAQSTPTFSLNTSTGVVTATVGATSGTAYANVTGAGYIGTATKSGTFSMTASSNTYSLGVSTVSAANGSASASATGGSASVTSTGIVTSSTATSYYVTASATGGSATANAAGGSASVTNGYAVAKSASGSWNNKSASGSTASNTLYIQAAAINNPSGSATQSKPTFSFNASNGVVTASVAATSGTAYRNVTTEGYIKTSTTGGTFSMGANSNTYSIGLASINSPSGSATQSKPTFSFNASNGVVTASVGATSGTAYANITGAGYTGTATKSGTFSMAANSNTYTIGLATINTPSGSATQSKPTFSFNASNGVVTASVAATSGTAYRNVTKAGYIGTSTTGGTFSMAANSNTYQIPIYSDLS